MVAGPKKEVRPNIYAIAKPGGFARNGYSECFHKITSSRKIRLVVKVSQGGTICWPMNVVCKESAWIPLLLFLAHSNRQLSP
jgi:hypothetical protein